MESAGPSGSEASSEAVMPAKATHQSRRLASKAHRSSQGLCTFLERIQTAYATFDSIEVEVAQHQKANTRRLVFQSGAVAQARIHVARFVIS